jgi:hypothetical protein
MEFTKDEVQKFTAFLDHMADVASHTNLTDDNKRTYLRVLDTLKFMIKREDNETVNKDALTDIAHPPVSTPPNGQVIAQDGKPIKLSLDETINKALREVFKNREERDLY